MQNDTAGTEIPRSITHPETDRTCFCCKICTLVGLVGRNKRVGWGEVSVVGAPLGLQGKNFHPDPGEAPGDYRERWTLSGEIRNEGKGSIKIVECNNAQSKYRRLRGGSCCLARFSKSRDVFQPGWVTLRRFLLLHKYHHVQSSQFYLYCPKVQIILPQWALQSLHLYHCQALNINNIYGRQQQLICKHVLHL